MLLLKVDNKPKGNPFSQKKKTPRVTHTKNRVILGLVNDKPTYTKITELL